MLNRPQAEYALIRSEDDEANVSYVLSNKAKITIENEKFRYNFISDHLLDIMKNWFSDKLYDSIETFVWVIWLLALLSVLDGQYSGEKSMLFSRIKNLFSISREYFLQDQEKKNASVQLCSALLSSARIARTLSSLSHFGASIADNKQALDSSEDIQTINIPEDFDFYACVEDTIQKLCVLETNIQQLEQSEGKYADIKAQIEQLAAEERKLTDLLPGFTYQKF